jgi:DNA-directed RNA polymerase specialized sigma24 family protein
MSQRQVMAWTYDGYQPNEIAVVLGKPVTTVRSLLRHARASLRQAYDPRPGKNGQERQGS